MSRDTQLAQTLGDYQAWLHAQARALLPAGSPDVEDLVQEGYIAMWRALGSYDPARGALPAWLVRKARGRMAECVTRKRWTGQPAMRHGRNPVERPQTVSLDAPQTEDGATLADLLGGPDCTETVSTAYHHGEIAEALDRLTPRQREYVQARFWDGLAGRELAAVFGYDPSALWNSPRNGARRKLAVPLAHLAELAHA